MKTIRRLLHFRGGNLPSESTCKPIRLLFLILFALLGYNGAWADGEIVWTFSNDTGKDIDITSENNTHMESGSGFTYVLEISSTATKSTIGTSTATINGVDYTGYFHMGGNPQVSGENYNGRYFKLTGSAVEGKSGYISIVYGGNNGNDATLRSSTSTTSDVLATITAEANKECTHMSAITVPAGGLYITFPADKKTYFYAIKWTPSTTPSEPVQLNGTLTFSPSNESYIKVGDDVTFTFTPSTSATLGTDYYINWAPTTYALDEYGSTTFTPFTKVDNSASSTYTARALRPGSYVWLASQLISTSASYTTNYGVGASVLIHPQDPTFTLSGNTLTITAPDDNCIIYYRKGDSGDFITPNNQSAYVTVNEGDHVYAYSKFDYRAKNPWDNATYNEIQSVQSRDVDYTVPVTSIPVKGITVSAYAGVTSITAGGSLQLYASVSPENATNKSVTWSSNNGNVTVNATGLVTANSSATGTVTITATAADGSNVSGSENLSITPSSGLIGVNPGKTWSTDTKPFGGFETTGSDGNLARAQTENDDNTLRIYSVLVKDNEKEIYKERVSTSGIYLNGTGHTNTDPMTKVIEFVANTAGVVKVTYKSSGDAARKIKIQDTSGAKECKATPASKSSSQVDAKSVAAGSVYIYSTGGGMWIEKIEFLPSYPESINIRGKLDDENEWTEGASVTGTDGIYVWNNVSLTAASPSFRFEGLVGSTWNDYGAVESETDAVIGESGNNVANADRSWSIATGNYRMTLDLVNNKLTIVNSILKTMTGKIRCWWADINDLYIKGGTHAQDATRGTFFPHLEITADGTTYNVRSTTDLPTLTSAGFTVAWSKPTDDDVALFSLNPSTGVVTECSPGNNNPHITTVTARIQKEDFNDLVLTYNVNIGSSTGTYKAFDKTTSWKWESAYVAAHKVLVDFYEGDGANEYIRVESSFTENNGRGLWAKMQGGGHICFKLMKKTNVKVTFNRSNNAVGIITRSEDDEGKSEKFYRELTDVQQTSTNGETSVTFTLDPTQNTDPNTEYLLGGVVKVDSPDLESADKPRYFMLDGDYYSASDIYVKSIEFTPVEYAVLTTLSAEVPTVFHSENSKMGFETGGHDKDENILNDIDGVHNLELVTAAKFGGQDHDASIGASGVKISGKNTYTATNTPPAPAYLHFIVPTSGSVLIKANSNKNEVRGLHMIAQIGGTVKDQEISFNSSGDKSEKFYLEGVSGNTDVYLYVTGGAITIKELTYTPKETPHVNITSVKIGGMTISPVTVEEGADDSHKVINTIYTFVGEPSVKVEYNTGEGTATQTLASPGEITTYKNVDGSAMATFTINNVNYTINYKQVDAVADDGNLPSSAALSTTEKTRWTPTTTEHNTVYIAKHTYSINSTPSGAKLNIYASEDHPVTIEGRNSGFFVTHGHSKFFEINVGGPGMIEFNTKSSNSAVRIEVFNNSGVKVGEIKTKGSGGNTTGDACTFLYYGGATGLHFVPVGGDLIRLNYIEWTPFTLESIAITPASIELEAGQKELITVKGTFKNSVDQTTSQSDITNAVGLAYTVVDGNVISVDNGTVTANAAGETTFTATLNGKTSSEVTVKVSASNELATLVLKTVWVGATQDGHAEGQTTFANFDIPAGTSITKTMLNKDNTLRAYADIIKTDGGTTEKNMYLNADYINFSGEGMNREYRNVEFKIGKKGMIHVEIKNDDTEARSYRVVAVKADGTTEVLRTMTSFKGDGADGLSILNAYYLSEKATDYPVRIFIHSTWGGLKLQALSYTPYDDASYVEPSNDSKDTYSRFSSMATEELVGIGTTLKVGKRNGNNEIETPITVSPKDGYKIESVEVTWIKYYDHDDDLKHGDSENWNLAYFTYNTAGASNSGIKTTTFYPNNGEGKVTIQQNDGSNAWRVKEIVVKWVNDPAYITPKLNFEMSGDNTHAKVTSMSVWEGQNLSGVLPVVRATDANDNEISGLTLKYRASKKALIPDATLDTYGYAGITNLNLNGGDDEETAISVTSAKDETRHYLPAATEYKLLVKSIAPSFAEENVNVDNVDKIDIVPVSGLNDLKTYYLILGPDDNSEELDWSKKTEYTDQTGLVAKIDDKTDIYIYAKSVLNGVESKVVHHHYVIGTDVLLAPEVTVWKKSSSGDDYPERYYNYQFTPKEAKLKVIIKNVVEGAKIYYEVIRMGFDEEGNNLPDFAGTTDDDSDGFHVDANWLSNPNANGATSSLILTNSVNMRIWAEKDGKRSEEKVYRFIFRDENVGVISSVADIGAEDHRNPTGMKITYGGLKNNDEAKDAKWFDKWTMLHKKPGADLDGDGSVKGNEKVYDRWGANGVLVYNDADGWFISMTAQNDALSEWASEDEAVDGNGVRKYYGKVKTSSKDSKHAGADTGTDKIGGSEYNHALKDVPVHIRTFNLPVYGAFWKFEPTQNGEIILHVEQQGCMNSYDSGDYQKVNGTKVSLQSQNRFDMIRKRPVYFVDEMGNSIQAKSYSTEARLDPEFIKYYNDTRRKDLNLKSKDNYEDYVDTDPDTGEEKVLGMSHIVYDKDTGLPNGMTGMQKGGTTNKPWYSNEDCWHMFDMYKTFLQETPDNGGFHSDDKLAGSIWDKAFKFVIPDPDNEGQWVEAEENGANYKMGGKWVVRDEANHGWNAKQEVIVLHSDAKHNPGDYSKNLLKKLKLVNEDTDDTNFDGTGYMLATEGYAKYRFPVEAGKTYFFFGWRTKFGVSGYEWIPNPAYDKNLYEYDEVKKEFKYEDAEKKIKKKKESRCIELQDSDSDEKNSDIIKNLNYIKPDFYEVEYNHEEHRQYHFTLKRKFKGEQWAPIVLPFSVSQTQLRDIFGSGVQVLHFDMIEESTSEKSLFNLHFLKHHYQMLVAGTPAYIYPCGVTGSGQDINENNYVENPTFTNVTLEMNGDNVTPIDDIKYGNGKMTGSINNGGIPQYGLFISGDKFYQYYDSKAYDSETGKSGKLEIKSLRGWIEVADALKTAGAKVNIAKFDVLGDTESNEMTGIINIGFNGILDDVARKGVYNNRVYNLNGQYVGGTLDSNTLPKGIYIKNGKKFVVK